MTHILSIIANPAKPTIDATLVGAIREAVKTGEGRNLSPGVAWEAPISAPPAPAAMEKLRAIGAAAQADVNAAPAANRRKKLLIADMDSTIIEQECIDELAEYAGKRTEISSITEQAMRGELDFEEALQARIAMLKGLPQTVLVETFERRISLTPGAQTLVRTMNALGAQTALVSGGFTFFTERVGAQVGFKRHQANRLVFEEGRLCGVGEPILGREAKREALLTFADAGGAAPEDALAVGDGANDLAMLDAAGLGVAFRAKPAVADAAQARINYGDLTALLYLQGIPQTEFLEQKTAPG